ncbi:MAG: DUF86 domain-containing protein [Candidatus Thorarchaeota archaeon]|nr:DUF86 domain-containing protein [Candidatus Thorarchaeota archaeon]
MIDQQRLARYKAKMQYIINNLDTAEPLTENPNDIEERALYYCLLTAIESTMDLMAMVIKDKGAIPKGDKTNIEFLKSEGLISSDLAEHLKKCNGLRNVLVHQYNGIDKEIVIESYSDVRETLNEVVNIIGGIIDES